MTGPMSTGTCNLCGKEFAKNVMSRHLKKCLCAAPTRQEQTASPGGKTRKTFWINVWGTYLPEYWLHLEVPTAAKLLGLDQFLRDIWLECCGHLSAFTIYEQRYEVSVDPDYDYWGERPKNMESRLYTVLQSGLKFDHEYDFGTTTELSLKVVAEQERAGQSREIRVLARNNPPDIHCFKCDKPATRVCSQCIYEGPKAWLCEQHVERHKCGEDMSLPVVNSPRVGQCGYTGGADFGDEF